MADSAGGLRRRVFPVAAAWRLADFKLAAGAAPAACFIAVGPRRVFEAVAPLKGYEGPIILLENDDKSVEVAKAALNQDNVYFAIPDVIASCTGSAEHLAEDPLSMHTENGTLHIDFRAKGLEGDIDFCDAAELRKQWLAKLYLHNTPHCIAAYLGEEGPATHFNHRLRPIFRLLTHPRALATAENDDIHDCYECLWRTLAGEKRLTLRPRKYTRLRVWCRHFCGPKEQAGRCYFRKRLAHDGADAESHVVALSSACSWASRREVLLKQVVRPVEFLRRGRLRSFTRHHACSC
jgi:hypothetical protein